MTTAAAAFIFGLITSVHCAGMCGPLACSLCSLSQNEKSRLLSALLYHGGRLVSYTVIGTLCGLLGEQPLKWFFNSPAVILPWLLLAGFLVFGLNLHSYLPKFRVFSKLHSKLAAIPRRFTAKQNSLALGLATPLLPCGPLYLLFAACLATGSALKGAEFALAFGLGTVPLLWLAQHSYHKLRSILPKNTLPMIQRGLALVIAVLLFLRLQGTLPKPQTDHTHDPDLPSCCH